ncbi:MAG: 3-keto-5-aminohexanoate cleavage protein [Gemmatimonadales bacterium]
MLLQAALNGARPAGAHPLLPVTREALAAAAAESVAAGAGAIHAHSRGSDGGESLAAADIDRLVLAIRQALPSTPLGVSTGAWIAGSGAERQDLVAGWSELPDFASVNFDEPGAASLARLLLRRGIGVEAGLSDEHATCHLAESGLADECLRVLLEPQAQDLSVALGIADRIEAVLESSGIRCPRLLHGTEATAWLLLDEAARRGYDARIGLEDILRLPDGTPADGNRALVVEARRRLEARA